MRYRVTWTQNTTHRSEVDLSDEQLAGWATTAVSGVLYASTLDALAGTSAEQLVALIRRNHHLRNRLLALYAQQMQHPSLTHTEISVVDVESLNHVDDHSHGR